MFSATSLIFITRCRDFLLPSFKTNIFNTTSGLFVAVFEERTPGNLGQKRIFSKLILRRLNQNLTTGLNLKTYNKMIQICSLQKGTISTFIIKDRQKREALM